MTAQLSQPNKILKKYTNYVNANVSIFAVEAEAIMRAVGYIYGRTSANPVLCRIHKVSRRLC